jgi:hypothetical protein
LPRPDPFEYGKDSRLVQEVVQADRIKNVHAECDALDHGRTMADEHPNDAAAGPYRVRARDL